MGSATSLTVLVYIDNGVGERARLAVPASLQLVLGPRARVIAVTAAEILCGALDSACALVIPGGADVPYCHALNGEGCARIRAFVAAGGIYIGFCAGAYFAAERIEWNLGQPDQILAPRELAFFPGVAVGPIFGPGTYDPYSEKGARIVPITTMAGAQSWAYYNGGCAFVGNSPETQVLARYSELPETPPAAVTLLHGKGRVILSGVHPEYSCSDLAPNHHLCNKLAEVDASRQALLQLLLTPLLAGETW
jgi:biotin--protein ligase